MMSATASNRNRVLTAVCAASLCVAATVQAQAAPPGIVYGTYLGSQGSDSVVSIQTDAAGNSYVFGVTNDFQTFPTTVSVGNSYPSASKCFVSKIDPSGANLVYSVVMLDT